MPDAQFPDDRLRSLGGVIDFPPTPELADRVMAHLPERAPKRRTALPHRLVWPVAAALAIAVALGAIPVTRAEIASWLDLPGIRIVVERSDDEAEPTALGVAAPYGAPSSADEAEALLGAPLRLPALAGDQQPAATWQRTSGADAMVTVLYAPSAELPEVGSTGVGLLLMVIDSPNDSMFLMKSALLEAPPEPVRIGPFDGFWIERGNLEINRLNADPYARPSANVLIWEANGLTYRMESALDRDASIRIAASMTESSYGVSPDPHYA